MFGEVMSHLNECSHQPPEEFTSWRALATYITLLASRARIPPQGQMKTLLLKMHRWMRVNSSRVPESVMLALAQATLCDRNLLLANRAAFTLRVCGIEFLKDAENILTCRTRNNKISLYTFTAHRYVQLVTCHELFPDIYSLKPLMNHFD